MLLMLNIIQDLVAVELIEEGKEAPSGSPSRELQMFQAGGSLCA